MRRNAIFALSGLEGAVLVALELLFAQLLAPIYGNTLFTWAATIAVMFGSMACGYWMANRFVKTTKDLKKIFLFASGHLLAVLLFGETLEVWLYSENHFLVSLVVTLLLFAAVPGVMLAMIPPYLVNELITHGQKAGRAAGTVFFVSTAAAIVSSLITGFVLIPVIGSVRTLIIIFLLLLLVTLVSIMQRKWIALTIVMAAAAFFFLRPSPVADKYASVLYREEGLNGEVMVADLLQDEAGKYSRVLFVNRMGQAYIEKASGISEWPYVMAITQLAGFKENPRVLLLGLGGGSVANALVKQKNATVDAVEFDARISKVAKDFFNLDRRVNVIIDDARHFMNLCDTKYDFVVMDLFKGEVPASHVLSVEGIQHAKKLLNEDGMLVINYSGFISGHKGADTRCVIKTMQQVFGDSGCRFVFTKGTEPERNALIIGVRQGCSSEDSTLLIAGRMPVRLNNKIKDSDMIDLSGDEILSDDKSLLEYLHLEAGAEWRKAYYKSFTERFLMRGNRLFPQ